MRFFELLSKLSFEGWIVFLYFIIGVLFFLVVLRGGVDLQKLPDPASYGCVLGLALCPSILSFLLATNQNSFIPHVLQSSLANWLPIPLDAPVIIAIPISNLQKTYRLIKKEPVI